MEKLSFSPLPTMFLAGDGQVLAGNEPAQVFLSRFGTIVSINVFHLFPECAHMAQKITLNALDNLQQLLTWHLPEGVREPSHHNFLVYLSPLQKLEKKKTIAVWQLILVDLTHWLAIWQHEQEEESRIQQQLIWREWAHEINNPLSGLLAATQWWQKSTLAKLPEPLREDTAPIIDMLLLEINRLRVRMAVMLSPSDERKKKVAVNVHQPLEQALHIFVHEFPEINILKDYDVSAPEVLLDSEQLQQVFDNLLRNAGQAMRRWQDSNSGINISYVPTLRLRSRVVNGKWLHGKRHKLLLVVNIEDNGSGMNSNNKEKKAHGHGLGLGIVRKLVSAFAADLSYTSEVGNTKWTLTLSLDLN